MKRFLRSTRALVLFLMAFNVTVILALAVVGAWAIDTMSREEDRESAISTQLIENVYRLNVSVDEELLAIRGYLLTGSERSVAAWREGQAHTAAAQRQLETNLSANDREIWGRFLVAQRDYVAYGEQLIALRRAGHEAASRQLFQTLGRQKRAALKASIDGLIAGKKRDIAAIHEQVNQLERDVKWIMAIAAGLAVPIILAVSIFVAWRVFVPLRDLEAASHAVASGRLDTRVVQRFDDEFGHVAGAFNVMAERVEHSHRELSDANEELKQLDRAKDEFLSVVSHELRTPLTVILGFGRLLETGMAGPLDDRPRSYVEKMARAADRMLLMVNDLLDFARLQHGKLMLLRRPMAYGPLVDEVVNSLRPLADEKGLVLAAEVRVASLLTVDGERVHQVLGNLVGNAIKFTQPGGCVTVRAVVDGGTVRTEVTDDGPGIAPEDHGKLFQRFSQLDMSATRQASGAGLGLSIARALVEAHGGRIGVESAPGHGATFWFTLPLVASAGVSDVEVVARV